MANALKIIMFSLLVIFFWKEMLAIVFFVFLILFLHSCFYTGIVYKRDDENKPRRTWL